VLEAMPDFTRVPTLLGPADLTTVDALIIAVVMDEGVPARQCRLDRLAGGGEGDVVSRLQIRAYHSKMAGRYRFWNHCVYLAPASQCQIHTKFDPAAQPDDLSRSEMGSSGTGTLS
jgi:hypothetical protein